MGVAGTAEGIVEPGVAILAGRRGRTQQRGQVRSWNAHHLVAILASRRGLSQHPLVDIDVVVMAQLRSSPSLERPAQRVLSWDYNALWRVSLSLCQRKALVLASDDAKWMHPELDERGTCRSAAQGATSVPAGLLPLVQARLLAPTSAVTSTSTYLDHGPNGHHDRARCERCDRPYTGLDLVRLASQGTP
jgi:hypothetical protein